MLTTPNFGLKKIELADSPPDITVINFNWDTIDTNLKEALDKGRKWDTFSKNGGTIGGPITSPSGKHMIYASSTGIIGFRPNGPSSDVGAVNLLAIGADKMLAPIINGDITLGGPSNNWKDIFLSGIMKGKNGYTKLPNGFILQWGEANFTANSGGSTVTFPIEFPTICYNIVMTNIYANSKAVVVSLGGTETTTSSFYAYLQDVITNNKPTYGCMLKWMAVGA